MNTGKKYNDLTILQALLLYAHNGCHGLIIVYVVRCGEHSPIDSVSNIMKLSDCDAARYFKFVAYSLIFIGCIVCIR